MYTAKETTINYLNKVKRDLEQKLERETKCKINKFQTMQQLVAIEIAIETIEDE